MESAVRNGTLGMKIAAILALIQGALGVIRTFHWFNVGSDLMGQGLLLFPLMGVVAFFRGILVTAIALLYGAFGCGALLQKAWARWLGLIAATVNLLLALSVIVQGEAVGQAVIWSIVPVFIIGYLLSSAGPGALKS